MCMCNHFNSIQLNHPHPLAFNTWRSNRLHKILRENIESGYLLIAFAWTRRQHLKRNLPRMQKKLYKTTTTSKTNHMNGCAIFRSIYESFSNSKQKNQRQTKNKKCMKKNSMLFAYIKSCGRNNKRVKNAICYKFSITFAFHVALSPRTYFPPDHIKTIDFFFFGRRVIKLRWNVDAI